MTTIGAASTNDALIKDATIETFERDVIEASMTVPVMVDFWAEWCGPCKQLGPSLEKAVMAAKGAVRLVKIDIDKNQMLASQLRIQSVPTVYAFFQGRPVDGFQGAIPASQINAFIARLTEMAGPGDAGGIDFGETLDAADAAMAQGQAAEAAEIYAAVAQAAADDDSILVRALAGLAKCRLATGDAVGARAVLETAPEGKRNDPAFTSVLASIDLAEQSGGGDLAMLKSAVEASPDDLDARYKFAEALVAAGDMAGAIDQLLVAIEIDREWNEGAAKEKLLKIFEALGAPHPLTLRGRRRLSSVLFA
jgi:putative thioredoxin